MGNRSLISNGLDVLPTLCDYTRVSIPDDLPGGRTIRPLAEGQGDNARRPSIVAENSTGPMLRSDRYKYCVYTGGTIRESLVDLQTDPGEMKNLAGVAEFCQTLSEHRSFLRQWIAESNDNEAKSFARAPHGDDMRGMRGMCGCRSACTSSAITNRACFFESLS